MASRSQIYPLARQGFAGASLNWVGVSIKVLLMAAPYNPDFTNVYLSDLQAEASALILATSSTITNPTINNGYLGGDSVNFGVISGGAPAGSVVFYSDTGTPSTSLLLAFLDTPDISGMPQVLSGLNYFLYQNQSYGGWFRL